MTVMRPLTLSVLFTLVAVAMVVSRPPRAWSDGPVVTAPAAVATAGAAEALIIRNRLDALGAERARRLREGIETTTIRRFYRPGEFVPFEVRPTEDVSRRRTQQRLRALDRIAAKGHLTLGEYRRQRELILGGFRAIDTERR